MIQNQTKTQNLSFMIMVELQCIMNQNSSGLAQKSKEILLSQVRPPDYAAIYQKIVIAVVFQITNLYLHISLLQMFRNIFQEMIAAYLILLTIILFMKINQQQGTDHVKERFILLVAILAIELSILFRLKSTTLIFTLTSIWFFYILRDDMFLIGPMIPITIQLFFIFVRIDQILMVPWWLLVFQVPIILGMSAFIIVQMPLARRQSKSWGLTQKFLFKLVYAFFFSIFLFFGVIFNQAYLGYQIETLLIMNCCFIVGFLISIAFLWQEAIYVLSFQQNFRIVVRNYQNTFLNYRSNNLITNSFSEQLCNKCVLRQANAITSRCRHVGLCLECVQLGNYKDHCIVCKKQASHAKIEFSRPLQLNVYKVKLYQQNEFKVYEL